MIKRVITGNGIDEYDRDRLAEQVKDALYEIEAREISSINVNQVIITIEIS